jgi:hypothetical protein
MSRMCRVSVVAKRASRTTAAKIASFVMHPSQACVAVRHALTNVYMHPFRCMYTRIANQTEMGDHGRAISADVRGRALSGNLYLLRSLGS